MAFWHAPAWQGRVADAIQRTLNDQHRRLTPLKLFNGAWTPEVMRGIGALAQEHCGDDLGLATAAYRNSARSKWHAGGEFMFDQTWIMQRANPVADEAALTMGIPLVLECEWLDWRNVWDDFDKLLLPKAGLRVMILQKHSNTPDDWSERLFARAAAYAEADEHDAWLLCCWISKDIGFTYGSRIGGKNSYPLKPVATT